jgi:hypothetical protein
VERIIAIVFGQRADDRLGRDPHLEGDRLEVLHRLARTVFCSRLITGLLSGSADRQALPIAI